MHYTAMSFMDVTAHFKKLYLFSFVTFSTNGDVFIGSVGSEIVGRQIFILLTCSWMVPKRECKRECEGSRFCLHQVYLV